MALTSESRYTDTSELCIQILTGSTIQTWITKARVNVVFTLATLPAVDTQALIATFNVRTCSSILAEVLLFSTFIYIFFTIVTFKRNIHYQMVTKWLPNGYQMVTKWLPNGYQMVTKWLPNGYQMVTKWLPNGYQMVTKWLPNGYQIVRFCCSAHLYISSSQ